MTNGTSMPLQLLPGPCYAVRRGRFDVTGCVFVTWSHARPFLDGFDDAVYRPFDDPRDAAKWLLLPKDVEEDVEEKKKDGDDEGDREGRGTISNVDERSGEDLVSRKLAVAEGSCPPGDHAGATGRDTSVASAANDEDSEDAASADAVGVAGSSASTAKATMVEDSTAGDGVEGKASTSALAGLVEIGEERAKTTLARRKRGRPKRGRPKRDRSYDNSGIDTDASDPFDDENDYRREKRRKRHRSITERWNTMFHRLALYKKRHGTCEVVSSGKSTADSGKGGDGSDTDAAADGDSRGEGVDDELSRWVAVQRREYKKLKDGRDRETTMFDEKIDKLRSIGFDFRYYTVDERIEQVRKYREVMCDPKAVPSVDHPMLGKFVRRYRMDCELHKRGRKAKHFTAEQLEKLEASLGLLTENAKSSSEATSTATATYSETADGRTGCGDGDMDDGEVSPADTRRRRRRGPTKAWRNMFDRLSQYRARHGTCDVPKCTATSSPADKELRKWISDQQQAYKRMVDGKHPHCMHDEKIRSLRSIGFDFGHYAFDERLEQLRHYREGCDDDSTLPPLDHRLLGKFVRCALEDCRLIDDGREPKHYSAEQIELLRSLPGGFDEANVKPSASLRYPEPDQEEEREWENMLSEWLRYKESEAANANAPVGVATVAPPAPMGSALSKGTALSKWVQTQRLEFRKLKGGTTAADGTGSGVVGEGGATRGALSPPPRLCRMTPRRLARLNDVGFDFGPRNGRYVTWEERLDQLRSFREEHGHCRVPLSHPLLGKWIDKTRFQYHRYIAGDARPGITEEKIRLLTEMGFVFQAGKRPSRPVRFLPWEDRFKQLLEFKRVHGTAVVPQHYTGVPGLGSWVNHQRKDYQKMIKGEKSLMTPQKALRLVEVGFVFNATSRRGKKCVLGDTAG